MNKLKVTAILLAVSAVAIAYIVVFRSTGAAPSASSADDAMARHQRECGDGDGTKQANLASCVALAKDLMGQALELDRSDGSPRPDDKARALLKRTCDQAYEPGCDVLARFDTVKRETTEARCKAAKTDKQAYACVEAGLLYKESHRMPIAASNLEKARALFDIACNLGNAAGCSYSAQVEQGQRRQP